MGDSGITDATCASVIAGASGIAGAPGQMLPCRLIAV
jgi:hypothetical protein